MRALAKLLCAHYDPQRVSKKTYSENATDRPTSLLRCNVL